jgi:hypothetical protein
MTGHTFVSMSYQAVSIGEFHDVFFRAPGFTLLDNVSQLIMNVDVMTTTVSTTISMGVVRK